MATFNANANPSLDRTLLDEVFMAEFDTTEGVGMAHADTPAIFKQITTDRKAHISEVLKGIGYFKKIGETEDIPLETPFVADRLTTEVCDFADGVTISKNLVDDDQHDVVDEIIKEFAMSAKQTMDLNAFGIYRGAFTTTLTAHGTPLISATQPILAGGTQSNLVTGALSQANLKAARQLLRKQANHAGVKMGNVGTDLLVPTDLHDLALEITGSELQADTANNNVNVFRSTFGMRVWTSIFLDSDCPGGSDTAWFLLSRNHSVRRLIRQGVQTDLRDWTQSNNRTYYYQAHFRETYFAETYLGIVGSLGV